VNKTVDDKKIIMAAEGVMLVGQCYQLNGKLLIDISELPFYLTMDWNKNTLRTSQKKRSKKEPVPPEGSKLWGSVYCNKNRDFIIESKDIQGLRFVLNLDKNIIQLSLCKQGMEMFDATLGSDIHQFKEEERG
jgi:hypothetical protein